MSEGESLFSNTLNIKRQVLADLIRLNEEKKFVRTLMIVLPDTVNAFYMPTLNSVNIPAGILNVPIYDKDASITIGENMADFAAMQVVMDIIGDDKEAQKECFESYARMWAQLGTVSYLTDSDILTDVHSSNVVRINAIVASFDQFYEIYGIEEDDPMYVAPEDRLRLW
jgi:putative endopeptidase